MIKKFLLSLALLAGFLSVVHAQNFNPNTIIYVDSIVDLENLVPSTLSSSTIYVKGYNGPNTPGGGVFNWVASSCTPDNGVLIASNKIPDTEGCWHRQIADTITPGDYGAWGDGSHDDTVAWVNLVKAINSGTANTIDGQNLIYMVYPETDITKRTVTVPVTASNFTLREIVTTTPGQYLIRFDGDNSSYKNITIDGNMNNMSSECTGTFYCVTYACVSFLGNSITVDHFTVENCAGNSVIYGNTGDLGLPAGTTYSGASFSNFKIIDGWNLGFGLYTITKATFTNGYFYNTALGFRNAYNFPLPYQQTFANGTNNSACMVVWFNSSHIQINNTVVQGCGRDGFFINTGAHDITITGSSALYNGDAGFSVNGDNINSVLPGNSICPWNVILNGDTAKGNVTGSGATCATTGLTFNGGDYGDNGRGVAEADMSSDYGIGANIFAAAGSINVRMNYPYVFDDRQGVNVTGTATGSGPYCVPVTGWQANLWQYNPNIAFYDGSGAFQGFGFETSDTSTQVCFNTTAFNSVTPGSIASGWYVTQRVTFNGARFGVDVGASGGISGGGFTEGPNGLSVEGYDIFADPDSIGAATGGVALDGTLTGVSLGQNLSLDADTSFWNSEAGSPTITHETGSACISPGCMQIVSTTANSVVLNGYISNVADYFQGSGNWVRAWAWVYQSGMTPSSTNGSMLQLCVSPGTYCVNSKKANRNGWQPITVTAYIPAGTYPLLNVIVQPGTTLWDEFGEQIVVPKNTSGGTAVTPPAQVPY